MKWRRMGDYLISHNDKYVIQTEKNVRAPHLLERNGEYVGRFFKLESAKEVARLLEEG